MSDNSFDARATLDVGDRELEIFRLDALQAKYDVARLPFSLKVLLENLLRTEGNGSVTAKDIEALATLGRRPPSPSKEIAFTPARVVMQDFTGVPAVVDLAAMRDAMADLGGDPAKINPLVPAELVIDHSVQVDVFGTRDAFARNAEREFERNEERYAFLRWGQDAFDNFAVVPPDTGIVHQVNLEYLARVVFVDDDARRGLPRHARRDRLAHDDDQRPRRARLGRRRDRGRGGDARPADVDAHPAGDRLQALRRAARGRDRDRPRPHGDRACCARKGVVGKFVEFYGPGVSRAAARRPRDDRQHEPRVRLDVRDLPDRRARRCATSSSPGRPKELIELVEAYAKEQGLWHDENAEEPTFSDTVELDLGEVVPSLAGPKRPQDRVPLDTAQGELPRRARRSRRRGRGAGDRGHATTRRWPRRSRPPTRPRTARPGHEASPAPATPSERAVAAGARDRGALAHGGRGLARRARLQARPRPRRDRRDHVVHEHVEPVGHARRRAARPQRARAAG